MNVSEPALISVIIPVYNLEKVISKCICSVINQTYKNLEIIIINDGSKDKSLEIINKYAEKDKRIRVISQENKGVGAAYNQGLKNVNGKYVYIIDGDNFIDSNLIETLYEEMIQTNCDFVMCSYYIDIYDNGEYYTDGYIKYADKKLFTSEQIAEKIFLLYKEYMWQSPCNKLYNTDVLSGNYFEEDKKYMMVVDSDFNLRLLNKLSKISILSKSLVHYVQYPIKFREQITSLWKYRYKSEMIFCEKKLYICLKNYVSSSIDNIDKLNCINNYFAGRFLKIIQMLFLDENIPKKEKIKELKKIKSVMAKLFKNTEFISYIPYKIMFKLIYNNNYYLYKYISKLINIISRHFPDLLKKLKAGQ